MANKGSGWKIVLIVFGVLILLGVLGVGLCVLSGVFWVRENAPAIQQAGQRGQSEAQEFAATHTQSECIDEGFRRHDACGEGIAMMCRTETRIFLDACLRAATATPGLCDGVPRATEIMESARWARQYCTDHAHGNDPQCGSFVGAITQYCAQP